MVGRVMVAAHEIPGNGVAACFSCGVNVDREPWCLCSNAMHWRHYCEGLEAERDQAVKDRRGLLNAIRWMSTATAFLRGGSLRKEWVLRVKPWIARAKARGW